MWFVEDILNVIVLQYYVIYRLLTYSKTNNKPSVEIIGQGSDSAETVLTAFLNAIISMVMDDSQDIFIQYNIKAS